MLRKAKSTSLWLVVRKAFGVSGKRTEIGAACKLGALDEKMLFLNQKAIIL